MKKDLSDQRTFWKQRWLKRHSSLILMCIVLLIGFIIYALFEHLPWLIAVGAIAAVVVYGALYNRMTDYVEQRIKEEETR